MLTTTSTDLTTDYDYKLEEAKTNCNHEREVLKVNIKT
jgi:hypothetical protein